MNYLLIIAAMAGAFGLADLETDKWTIQPVVYQPLPGTSGPATDPQVAPGGVIHHYSSCTYGCATVNPTTGEIIIGDGFSSDVVAKDIYANSNWVYNPSDNTYKMISYRNYARTGPNATLSGFSQYPTPPDAHTYGCLTYCGRDNHLYLMHGAHQHTGLKMMWKCNYETGRWTKLNPSNLPDGGFEMHAIYVPWVDRIIHIDKSGYAWYYSFDSNSWVRKAKSPNGALYGGSIKLDTKREKVIGWGGGDNKLEWYDPVTDVWETVTPSTGVKPPSVSRGPICYYSKYDRYIAFGGSGIGDNTWMFNPETRVWKHLSMKPTFKLANTDFDDFCINMDYSEKYDVAVYADRKGGISSGTGILMMRLSPETAEWTGTGIAESKPVSKSPVISVSPNPFSSSVSINVSVEARHAVPLRIHVYNSNGRLLKTGGPHIKWQTGHLPPGVYIIKVKTGQKTLTKRVILAR